MGSIIFGILFLLMSAGVYGQEKDKNSTSQEGSSCKAGSCPYQMPVVPMTSGYDAPANIHVGDKGRVDVCASASFLYWQPIQDNMAIALVQETSSVTTVPNSNLDNRFVQMHFDFVPGFKVGLGANLRKDNWESYAEYTRVHGTHKASSNGSSSGVTLYVTERVQALFPPEMGAAISSTSPTVTPAYQTARATYRNNLDFLDAELARSYYVGKCLTFRTALGARSAWILQHFYRTYVVTADPTTARQLDVDAKSDSWGIGPRVGLTMDWLLGCGFRCFGSGYGDILYTWYKLHDKSSVTFFNSAFSSSRAGVNSNTFNTKDRQHSLKPHVDLELGFGWDTYFAKDKWHVDFSAAYGFQVFFSQNMFRHWDGLLPAWNTVPYGNLYVNGLTATAKLDF
jgi:hypothetical protein